MNKRTGFRPRYVRSQYQYNSHVKEGFDIQNLTSTTKNYIIVDADTGKFAIAYDESDTNNSSPLIIKPVDIHDKTQWVTVDADIGIINFVFDVKNHVNADISISDGVRHVKKADTFNKIYLSFAEEKKIKLNVSNSEYYFAFKTANAKAADKSIDSQLSEWNNTFGYYNDKDKSTESFSLKRLFERFDSPTYLEVVEKNDLKSSSYCSDWRIVQVWDQRRSTSAVLETEKLAQLQTLDDSVTTDAATLVANTNKAAELVKNENTSLKDILSKHILGKLWY